MTQPVSLKQDDKQQGRGCSVLRSTQPPNLSGTGNEQ